MTDERRPKDIWDKIDVIAKGILAVTVPAVIAFYSITLEQNRAKAEEADRQARTIVQLANARETETANLRSKMFETLLQHYFEKQDDETRIVVLELIGLNFRDAIQIKPLFERLDRELTHKPVNAREMLRDASHRIIQDQLEQVRMSKDGHVCYVELTGKERKNPDCMPILSIALNSVGEDVISINTNTKNGKLLNGDESQAGDSFKVSYFDMPMVDFSTIEDISLRYSVVLLKADPTSSKATIAIAVLPTAAISKQSSYAFDELLNNYVRSVDQP
jgi:regulator of replication initiation timing